AALHDADTPIQHLGTATIPALPPGADLATFRLPGSLAAARSLTDDFVLTGELPEGDTPAAVRFTPDGARIIIAHRDTRNLIVFDAVTRAYLGEILLSGSPNDLDLSPDGTRAVTANIFEDTASIVDLTAGQELATVAVGEQPGVARIASDGSTAVIGNTVSGDLSVIDIATATETRRIGGIGFVGGVSFAFESGAVTATYDPFVMTGPTTLIHADFYADLVHFVDVTTGAVSSIPTLDQPRAVAVTPDGLTAVVAHTGAVGQVSVIDVAAQSIAKTIPIGVDLTGRVTVEPTGTKAVVSVQNACRVVNLDTNAVSPSLSTASVSQLLTTADGAYALGVGFYGSLISYATESIVTNLNEIVSTTIGAVSPTGPRAALIANLNGEDMLVVNTAGGGGHLEAQLPSGPAPEGDKARTLAISPDGTRAVVVNNLSDNATIVDLLSLSVEAIVDVGDRPAEVAITPDGTRAVVVNLDSDFVSIIDLVTHAVSNVTISRRASQVEISPDGQYAYIAVVVNDGVWRVDLQTASVAGPRLPAGQMGSIYYAYFQASGMTLSHDGGTLVACNTYDDTITLIDTATWTVVATVPVGDFPVRATFAIDDSVIYVSHRNDDTIRVVTNAGGGSSVIQTIFVGDQPYEMALAPDNLTLYVANAGAQSIGVVDLASGSQVAQWALPNAPVGVDLDPSGLGLYVASGSQSVTIGPGPLFSINLSGEVTVFDTGTGTIRDQVVTGLPPAQQAFNAARLLVGVASPPGDGLVLVQDDGGLGIEAVEVAPRPLLATLGPNPLSRSTRFEVDLSRTAHVKLTIHDVTGRCVRTLVDAPRAAGAHEITWDARDASGERLAAGTYFARLVAGDLERSVKLVVVD
ncbi:MAG: FlgD immunoglobulin-like domain containing protein, partial [Candidatus Eiseniibacteriota bacterium]